MECNHQSPVPSNSNRERASNIQGALTPEEVLSQEGYGSPNNQLVISYHRRYPDGEYVPGILSPGFRFCPEDDELIVDYLNKEINKEKAPYISCIPKVNVYKYTPEELAESHKSMGKDEWYFFSPRDRKYLNGNRPNRAAGNGYWKATAADKKIYRNGEYVGSKKSLVFYRGNPQKGNKTNWIMKEYMAGQPRRQRLPNAGANDMRLDDCVLCRIYKISKYSPKEETEAAAFHESVAAPKRVKTEHEGTNQHHINLPVLQPNRQMIQPRPTPQQNLQELQPNLSMPQQNQQEMQCCPQPWTNNLGGQLHFRPESNPEEAQPIMPQPNLPSPQQNPQTIMQYSQQQPWSYNLGGGQLDFRPESNIPEEAQPIMLQPNLPSPQQNLQAIQCSLQAGSGGQLDFPMASISEEANQSHFDNLGNSHEPFDDLISIDMDGNLTHPPVFPDGFGLDDFYPLSSMFLEPIPPSLDNNDHPQNGR